MSNTPPAPASAESRDAPPAQTQSHHGGSRVLARMRWIALVLLMVATIAGALAYWRHSELYPTTDNAYVGAHIVRVAAEVSGPVTRVYVRNNELVKANDPLFDIDAAPYEAALREARAQFDRAAQAAGNDANGLREAADALQQARLALIAARRTYQEARAAQVSGQPTATEAAAAEKAWQEALAALAKAQADFDAAQTADLRVAPATVQLRAAAAALDRAEYERVRALVNAPGGGWVSDLSLRPGTTVAAGAPLFAIIETGSWWVDANFKETDLARIREGQPAEVVLDMYPGRKLTGTVESISAGSGAVFSVLPPENATGNWVKVTQRFAVRVALPEDQDPALPLRVGASASVTVDTTKGPTTAASAGQTRPTAASPASATLAPPANAAQTAQPSPSR